MTEQHNYDGNSVQVNHPQGPTVVGNENQITVNYYGSPPQRSLTEQILWRAVQEEVDDRLRQSLHNQVLINLGKEAQPQQVHSKRPWDWEVKIGPNLAVEEDEALPPDWGIGEIFSQTKGKLLILGNPGSGKTTTLLDLGRVLLQKAAADPHEPIPVLVNLSSWKNDQQTIADWLQEEIRLKYGVSPKLGQQWIADKKLLPLLDGLDEVAAERQETCVKQINDWLTSDLCPVAMVVCSRTEEYGLYQTNLQLQGAIGLKPLTLEQMQTYLRGLGKPELATSLETDAGLRDLVQAPLLLSMAVIAFGEGGLSHWRGLTTEQDRLTWLLDAYVVARLQKEYEGKAYLTAKVPSARQTRMWLTWLAQLMEEQSRTEFLIESVQPFQVLRNPWEIWKYQMTSSILIFGLMFGLLGGMYTGLIFGLMEGFLFGIMSGLMTGLMFGLMFGWTGRKFMRMLAIIPPAEIFQMSISHQTKWQILGVLFQSLPFLAVMGLVGGIYGGLYLGMLGVLIFGLLITVLFGSLTTRNSKTYVEANQGTKILLKNALIFEVIGFSIALLLCFSLPPLLALITQLQDKSIDEITTFMVFMTFVMTLMRSLMPACQHLALRLVLTFSQHSMPWNYARFLNYCTERTLLQRVGGRYRFIHKLLQDHFASMP
jgi:NACHT domain